MDEPPALRRHPLAKHGPALAIAGGAIFLALWLAAILATGDWVLGRDTLSELGGKDNLAAPLFNVGCIIAGACMFLFGFSIWLRVPEGRLASGFLRLAAAGLVLVGIFNIRTGLAHGLATLLFFMMLAVGLAVLLYVLARAGIMRATCAVIVAGFVATAVSALASTLEMTEAVAVLAAIAWSCTMGLEMRLGERAT
jgi:hypothetical membrane protein